MFARPLLILFLASVPVGTLSAQELLREEFNSPSLDLTRWCPCQIDMEHAPVTFHEDDAEPGTRFARIVAPKDTVGGKACRYDQCRAPVTPGAMASLASPNAAGPSDSREPLGPSISSSPGFATSLLAFNSALVGFPQRSNPYCVGDIKRRAASAEENLCLQRQELRLQQNYRHPADEPHLYSFRFRLPARIEDRINALRWVTAQWKNDAVSDAYAREFGAKWDGHSPFLAQRFDDGILHVTVQDEHCRCRVASAPDLRGGNAMWSDGPARYCESTRPDVPEHTRCTAALNVQYGPDPILPSALGQWVEMRYRVEASRARDAMIEVYAGDRFIVRVTGRIGYEPPAGAQSATVFKIGHYRDYQPYPHAMDIDWVRIVHAAPANGSASH